MTPGSIYRQALKDLDSKSYAAGNFTGCGTTRKVYSKISLTIQNEKHDYEQLNSRLLKLERKLKEEDKENSKRLANPIPFYGYLLGFNLTSSHLYACFSGAGQIMLYRDVINIPDILYFDATGSLLETVKPFKRILYYSLTTRHPFGTTPPVPVFEFVSSEHTSEAIRRGLQDLQCYDQLVHKSIKVPLVMMCDFSAAIIAACLKTYNNQTRTEYLDMLYDAVVTKSKVPDAENTMIRLVCVAHIMKTNGRSIDRLLGKRRKTEDIKSIRHFAMRVVGLLANCKTFEQVERIVKHTAIVFKSEIVSDPIRTSLKFLEESINTFQIPDEDFQQICNEGLENDEQSHMVGKLSKFQSQFEKIVNSLAIDEGEVRTEASKYFFPTFLDYLLQ